jgi:hypothetical protein
MDAFPTQAVSHQTDEVEKFTDLQMRRPSVASHKGSVMERTWGHAARVDDSVTFEEYLYWAKIEREMEQEEEKRYRAETGSTVLQYIKQNMSAQGRQKRKEEKEKRLMALQSVTEATVPPPEYEKTASTGVMAGTNTNNAPEYSELKVTDAEWRIAARAMRTASWGQMFFLITTDILGWSGAP